jgi:hypothetical protein
MLEASLACVRAGLFISSTVLAIKQDPRRALPSGRHGRVTYRMNYHWERTLIVSEISISY